MVRKRVMELYNYFDALVEFRNAFVETVNYQLADIEAKDVIICKLIEKYELKFCFVLCFVYFLHIIFHKTYFLLWDIF